MDVRQDERQPLGRGAFPQGLDHGREEPEDDAEGQDEEDERHEEEPD
ncbi:MAG: hypothetical protein MZV65_40610 [Chromatiales bacterium]|nr:hypothetical protein [Chromatiales bacterium]